MTALGILLGVWIAEVIEGRREERESRWHVPVWDTTALEALSRSSRDAHSEA